MDFFTKSPRRTIILGSYVLLIIVGSWILKLSAAALLLLFLLLTIVLVGIFHVDCAAMLGNFYYSRGQADRAVPYFKFSIAHHTKSPAAYMHYAVYLLRRGGAKEAVPLLEKTLAFKPKTMIVKSVRLTQASCQWVLGNVDGAIDILEGMRRDFEYVNAQVISTLSYMYYLRGELERAEELSLAAIEDTPGTASAWDNLGQIYYTRNDFAKAKEMLQKALEYKNDLPDSLYYLGLIARDEGEKEQAAEYFNRALGCPFSPLNTVSREQVESALAEG